MTFNVEGSIPPEKLATLVRIVLAPLKNLKNAWQQQPTVSVTSARAAAVSQVCDFSRLFVSTRTRAKHYDGPKPLARARSWASHLSRFHDTRTSKVPFAPAGRRLLSACHHSSPRANIESSSGEEVSKPARLSVCGSLGSAMVRRLGFASLPASRHMGGGGTKRGRKRRTIY